MFEDLKNKKSSLGELGQKLSVLFYTLKGEHADANTIFANMLCARIQQVGLEHFLSSPKNSCDYSRCFDFKYLFAQKHHIAIKGAVDVRLASLADKFAEAGIQFKYAFHGGDWNDNDGVILVTYSIPRPN